MSDSRKSSIHTWQQPRSRSNTGPKPEDKTYELARRFLEDETVKAATHEEKRTFLKGKGLKDTQITQLLDESWKENEASVSRSMTEPSEEHDEHHLENHEVETREVAPPPPPSPSFKKAVPAAAPPPSPPVHNAAPMVPYMAESTPPIVTYPEFLTTPQRPPPLLTPGRLANLLAVSGGVWALLYGVAGLAVRPMVDNLNESRTEYYDHVNRKLSQLVRKLEGVVTEVPYKNGKMQRYRQQDRDMDDNMSVSSDPTELFHRDIGTQTSPPPSIADTESIADVENPIDVQARRLDAISAAVREISRMQSRTVESKTNLKSAFSDIQDSLDKLAYPAYDFSTYGGLGYPGNEPDDEFKRTKDAIRSVKGALLSARSFPVGASR